MQTKYEVATLGDDGQWHPVREILGTLRQKNQVWEMHSETGIVKGTLSGDPLSEHSFTDVDGLHYRVV